MKTRLIILFLTSNIIFSHSQTLVSKAEMYEDYDFMVNCIKESNPHLELFDSLMSHSIVEKLIENRRGLDTITDELNFFLLLQKSIGLIPEVHAKFIYPDKLNENSYSYYKKIYPHYFTNENMAISNEVNSIIDSIASKRLTFHFPNLNLTYINGDYYTISPVAVIDEKDTIHIPVGSRLTHINGEKTNVFLKKNQDDYYFSDKNCYDVINHSFYNFYVHSPSSYILSKTNYYLGFQLKNSTDVKIIHFSGEGVKRHYNRLNKLGEIQESAKPKVELFDSILYIRMPNMDATDTTYYINTINDKALGKEISKVVIDIRNNPGGSDYTWRSVLSHIIDQKLYYKINIGFRANHSNFTYLRKPIEEYPLYHDSTLNADFRLICSDSESSDSILPSNNSINYSGEIYLLANKNSWSSACAFIEFGNMVDNIVTIGEPRGRLGGFGVDPELFQLPNTKLIFKMLTTIQIPCDKSKIQNYFWDNCEINVDLTPSFENILFEYSDYNYTTQEFLFKWDIYFRKALIQK